MLQGRKILNDDKEFADDTDIPFQIAYAVSIHKAQGLEYDSVKVIITEEVDEMITHNIFYTAITRSKKHLKNLLESRDSGEGYRWIRIG